jgi:hypothetical protein
MAGFLFSVCGFFAPIFFSEGSAGACFLLFPERMLAVTDMLAAADNTHTGISVIRPGPFPGLYVIKLLCLLSGMR